MRLFKEIQEKNKAPKHVHHDNNRLPHPSLPYELWQEIIELLLDPAQILDLALSSDKIVEIYLATSRPDRQEDRRFRSIQRRNLSLVCKTFKKIIDETPDGWYTPGEGKKVIISATACKSHSRATCVNILADSWECVEIEDRLPKSVRILHIQLGDSKAELEIAKSVETCL